MTNRPPPPGNFRLWSRLFRWISVIVAVAKNGF
jgi:hypothetical protein